MEATHKLTHRVVFALLLAFALGMLSSYILSNRPLTSWEYTLTQQFSLQLCPLIGTIFIRLLKLLVVPIVLFSLLSGITSLEHVRQFGTMGIKALLLYIATTICAITLALTVASWLQVGSGTHFALNAVAFTMKPTLSLTHTLIQFFPDNLFSAFTHGNLMQIIVFALLFGTAILKSGEAGKKIAAGLQSFQIVLNQWVMLIISITPIGVFCLVTNQIARSGLDVLMPLLGYFMTVLLVLAIQFVLVYGLLLHLFSPYSWLAFIKRIFPAMLFAFGTSSSNASIPMTLKVAQEELNIDKATRAFVIPLGATINMDGTAIMQGVATIFLINLYHAKVSLIGYLTVILMATFASIGAAGIPSAGLITLAMVLQQIGIPVEGIAMIIGIDRLLDMTRTAINVCGDLMVATIINHKTTTPRA
jgi:Na+/H+-dicarboxylate symporter